MSAPLLQVRGLVKHFPVRGALLGSSSVVHALDGVDLDVAPGELVAVVGESGSGKTTLARCILGLARPTDGEIRFHGNDVTHLRGRDRREFRRRVQPIFQDPYASLDPRWPISRTIREPLDAFGIGTPADRARRVTALLERVGLPGRFAERRPHELSGGQRQRVGIAAALALDPELIVADEPVSALDVSVQAQILNLLAELQRDLGLAMLLITHNLAVVEHVCDRAAVLYLGQLAEEGPIDQLFGDPEHPYTRTLMAAIPYPDPARRLEAATIRGEIPSPIHPPTGCRFHPRCPVAIDLCRTDHPELTTFGPSHRAACHVARMHAEAAAAAIPETSTSAGLPAH
ncbi:MAG TPA: ABC transporter ATP-binding protein [Candidatus Limnocylindrales bacterium]|nr:ABC transporter ATP-binding protein [Candidatus Limnocylindrales bacterium]